MGGRPLVGRSVRTFASFLLHLEVLGIESFFIFLIPFAAFDLFSALRRQYLPQIVADQLYQFPVSYDLHVCVTCEVLSCQGLSDGES